MAEYYDKVFINLFIIFVEYILVLLAICADLWSGVRKAKERGEARTSYGYKRTVDKLSRYYNFMFAFTVLDAMQMVGVWYLGQFYGYGVPLFPVATLLGAIALCAIEIKSIYEKADEKERAEYQDVLFLAKEIAKYKSEPDEIAAKVAEYLNRHREE